MSSDSSNVSPGMTVEDCPLHVDMVITAIDIDERHRFRMLVHVRRAEHPASPTAPANR